MQASLRYNGGDFSLPDIFVASADLREQRFAVLPCEVRATVVINGRAVVDTLGAVVEIAGVEEGFSGRLIVKTPIVASSRNLFPRFAAQ